ncbi:P-type conjugative transfer protein TrbL [Rhodomicrobium vannielii ATCC 17100]|uniref:P-type conjugative transfer protein TrbL n=1 Tax=Rhodomicrobium vannielii TaxID=1069 RepID=UPI001917F55C|nr:P-type conjugative transfer protein TrbL [Rhodomicrobium vannielii]MBJ7533609.1 P-type conjugative transfer protein TrbL [Rhodomicrobium vannielii ATCC 17100]
MRRLPPRTPPRASRSPLGSSPAIGAGWALIGVALGVLVVSIISASPAAAAEPTTNALDGIVRLYQQNAQKWEATLATYAQTLFWLLAAIEMSYAAIRLAFRGADVSEWMAELVNQILFIGFFLALLVNSSAWAAAIVNSFRTAANEAVQASGGTSLIAPSDIFAIGLSMANKVLDQSSIWSPGSSVGLIIFALVLLICFALIAAFLVLALVESYVVISAGILFMGFGGSRWTKDYALKMVTYALSVGAKLFVLQLLIGLGQQIFNALLQNFETNTSDLLVSVGSAIVMLALTKIIPDMIQGLINGTQISGGGALAGVAGGAAGVGWGAFKGGIGAGMVTARSSALASEQMQDARMSGSFGPGRVVRMAGNTAMAAGDTLGMRLSGRIHYGTWAGQMAEALKERTVDRQAARSASEPAQPQGSVTGRGQPAQRSQPPPPSQAGNPSKKP